MIRLQPDESYASLLSTHHITQAYIQPFIGYIPNNRPPVGLDDYLKLYLMITENKTFKIISKQPTYDYLVPHVYLTPKGVNLLTGILHLAILERLIIVLKKLSYVTIQCFRFIHCLFLLSL